ncbi:MAG: LytTR family DNA-binding domain-containing protein [Lachnospiraceae bacterium]|nr:LytTR family DNA-binding domain-containing protein [Lachnospiraceae bacterium]
MIRVAIVEDEAPFAQQLTEYLHRYETEKQENFAVTRYTDGDEIVENYKAQFDIILMDVQMRFMDGMAAAEEIRKQDSEVVIIFITNMRQYALRGYAVDALDYVVKPVTYFAFSERLGRAIGRMKHRQSNHVVVNIRGGVLRIDAGDIYYVESQGHTLIYHTNSGVYEGAGTMKEIEESLTPYDFFRGNKGFLINLAHVDSVKDGCAVVKGEELMLSRARKNQFMEALTNYWSDLR